MEKLIDVKSAPVSELLDVLLEDKTTGKNIIWATDTYISYGVGFTDKHEIEKELVLEYADIIKPRIRKSQEDQLQRTRKKAEVFTPARLCNKMNNYCDEDWFWRKNVFNLENDDGTWTVNEEKIPFSAADDWKKYVLSRRLEITCGEAPYLVSRYDASSGELILPLKSRIGILDRKMRAVNENSRDFDEWFEWCCRAFESCYGYEYQGDNLLIARINLLLSFCDYYKDRFGENPNERELKRIANVISWNLWQMDGLGDTAPLGKPYEEFRQYSLFDIFCDDDDGDEEEALPCKIRDWRGKKSIQFSDLKHNNGDENVKKKLFDYVIGNPPYQDETNSDSTRMPPVYNLFMDETYKVAEKVELVTPARFLFNAGYTPSAWNEKMLNDEHFKVLYYEQNSSKVFVNTDIKGGIAISYRDCNKNFGAIKTFTIFDELNSILKKVCSNSNFKSIKNIVAPALSFGLTEKMLKENPNSVGRLRTSCFTTLPEIFYDEKPNDGKEYIKFLGLLNGKRTYKYVRRDYILDKHNRLDVYKVILPASNGSGALGEVLSTPLIGTPLIGYSQTFISIGSFSNLEEAENCLKYVKSKFARVMLGVLKITQHNPPDKWKYVPLQDFTSISDIDWSKSIAEIDEQLYRKYGLDEKEIDFIETHVKEMA